MATKPRPAKAKPAVAPFDQVAENIGESLARFLNRVESQWKAVRGQRDSVVTNLRAIRDTANALLADAGEIELRVPEIFRRRGKTKGSKAKKKTPSPTAPSSAASGPARPKKIGRSKAAPRGAKKPSTAD